MKRTFIILFLSLSGYMLMASTAEPLNCKQSSIHNVSSQSFLLHYPPLVLGNGAPCASGATVTDKDGNIYNTVQIGRQCWMKENLRVTKYENGTVLESGGQRSENASYWHVNGNPSNDVDYGLLYNFKAVMGEAASSSANPSGVQGICPTGWHVPSDAEWTELYNYVASCAEYVCGSKNNSIAKSLASTTGWTNSSNMCDIGCLPTSNNTTGFSAYPAGYYGGSYNGFGTNAYFWTSTAENGRDSYYRYLHCYNRTMVKYSYRNNFAMSVRCVSDTWETIPVHDATIPTVTTNNVSSVAETSATSGGYVTYDGGAAVTARGVCWSTKQNPTIADNHTADGSGKGSFTSNLTGLSPNTTYYVRSYATNSEGTAYGDEVSFKTLKVINPEVLTLYVSDINSTTATCGGRVNSEGGSAVTARGVCWNTTQNPTIADNHTLDGGGTGSFASSLTGLLPNMTYYVRAYATNSSTTSYGEEKTFTTPAALPMTIYEENMGTASSNTDIEDNIFQDTIISYYGTSVSIRATSPSATSTVSYYPSASGSANLFMSSTNSCEFLFGKINTEGYTDIELAFGLRKGGTVTSLSDLEISYSKDSINWIPVTMTKWERYKDGVGGDEYDSGNASNFPVGAGTSGWYYITCKSDANTIPASSEFYLKFNKVTTGNGEIRIDDIKLTGK